MKSQTCKAAIVALLLTSISYPAVAQTISLPGNTPVNWHSAGSATVTGINTAMIAKVGYINVLTYLDNGGGTGVMATDDMLGSTALRSLSGTPTGTPDVAIGNDPNGGADDYIVLVAYPTSSGVVVDYFLLYDNGATITLGTSPICSLTMNGAPNTVHIDIIADFSATIGGFPICEWAAVTWDNSGTVYVAEVDLSITSSGSLTPVSIGAGSEPDVAGIYRTVSSTDRMALVTYTNASSVSYREYNFNTTTLSGVTTLDAGGSGITFAKPRIDAIDDYNINTTGSQSNYKVVVETYTGSNYEIRTYDDNGASGWVSSAVITLPAVPYGYPGGPYDHFSPTVAFGGPNGGPSYDGTQYMISHFTDDGSEAVVFMEPVDFTAPTSLVNPPDNYYWVSQPPGGSTVSTSGNYANSVVAPCNNMCSVGFVAWAYPNGSGGSDIFYKFTPYPYSFKPGTNSIATEEPKVLHVYPNPTDGKLTIGNAGRKTKFEKYEITDLVGRTVQQGNLKGGSTGTDIYALTAGTYIIKVYEAGTCSGQALFVKK